jgi:hypothetical protein
MTNAHLAALAKEAIEKRWEQIETYPEVKTQPLKKGQTQRDLVQMIYAKLTSHQFCRQRPQDRENFLQIIAEAVYHQEPISCILGHGPLKNPNNCSYTHMDWAEFFAYAQLMKLASAIKTIYEPGLSISFYLDDARAAYANHVSFDLMNAYKLSLIDMIQQTALSQVVTDVVSLSNLYPLFRHGDFIEQAEKIVIDWQLDPQNQATLQDQIIHAIRNLPNRDVLDEVELWDEARKATHRYLLYYEAEKLCGIWSQPNKLYMRYSPHSGFYQIFTLRKGSVSQPWQGQGAFMMMPNGKVDPYLVTRKKMEHCQLLESIQLEYSQSVFREIHIYGDCPVPNYDLDAVRHHQQSAALVG